MNNDSMHDLRIRKLSGYSAISGALLMITGAIFWNATGADLWQALAMNQVEVYLAHIYKNQMLAIANTTFWILGVLVLNLAATTLSGLFKTKKHIAQVALLGIRTAVPLAIVAFIIMLSLALKVAPQTTDQHIALATSLGWIATRLDDLATILIIGAGPFFFSLAGYGEWIPGWLRIWGFLAGVVGLGAVAGTYIATLAFMNFALIPVGMLWMVAAGIVLIRKAG